MTKLLILSTLFTLSVFAYGCPPNPKADEAPYKESAEPAVDSAVSTDKPDISPEPVETPESVDLSTSEGEKPLLLGLDLPENWPGYIPLMEGAVITNTEVTEDGNMVVEFETSMSLEEATQFLIEKLPEYEWVGQQTMRSGTSETEIRLFYARRDEGLAILGGVENGVTKVKMLFTAKVSE